MLFLPGSIIPPKGLYKSITRYAIKLLSLLICFKSKKVNIFKIPAEILTKLSTNTLYFLKFPTNSDINTNTNTNSDANEYTRTLLVTLKMHSRHIKLVYYEGTDVQLETVCENVTSLKIEESTKVMFKALIT